MNWTAKIRTGGGTVMARSTKPGPASTGGIPANMRTSNGLKEFLWLISDARKGRVLDLGPVWQSTVNFFIEKGYRVTTEDLLRAWKEFLTTEEERMRQAPVGEEGERVSQTRLAEKFLEGALQYAAGDYHGVLAWDLLDYFDSELLPRVMARLYDLLHPGGAVLALFHSRPADRFHRYRIVDAQTIEMMPASTLAVHARVMQNREILDVFGKFRSSKTFVGRDQLREGLFLK